MRRHSHDSSLWEIAENLHRSELTKLERAEHLDEWRRLTLEKSNAQVGHSGGKPDRGHSATVREFGVTRQDVERAEKIANLAPEAKQAAIETGRQSLWSVRYHFPLSGRLVTPFAFHLCAENF